MEKKIKKHQESSTLLKSATAALISERRRGGRPLKVMTYSVSNQRLP